MPGGERIAPGLAAFGGWLQHGKMPFGFVPLLAREVN